ncbi:hypothetical protein HCH54_008939 [Aspergillus fumigatus]
MIEQFGADWGLNARGIYYRHFYSPGWVTSDHELWLPSLDGIDWNHFSESSRLSRAEAFLKHVLNNERWKKSEYAWEADAWSDVFGQMKNDPVLAVDKHEYNTVKLKRDPVSCLLVGEPKFVKRIPDATFGLATFKPKDYQNILAEWDLDHDRLEALYFIDIAALFLIHAGATQILHSLSQCMRLRDGVAMPEKHVGRDVQQELCISIC